ncbi:hypothetical protein D9M71_842890 [compost metagenome]
MARYDHDLCVVESLLGDVCDSGVPELMKPNAAIKPSLYTCKAYSLSNGVRSYREYLAVRVAFHSCPQLGEFKNLNGSVGEGN